MDQLILISIILSGILCVLRGLDLAFFTEAATGLPLMGSVWLRYGALAVTTLAAVLAGQKLPDGDGVRRQSTPAGFAAAGAAACFVLAGVTRLLFGLDGIGAAVRALLELFCWVWMSLLARNWFRKGPWHRPTRSLYPAVVGSVLFYWCVLARFMENSSSWHRVAPTAAVWQMLAAVVFLASLARTLYLPENTNARMLGSAGLSTFALCLCWQLPQSLSLLANGLQIRQLPELLFGLGVCCIGALGGICVLNCVCKTQRKAEQDSARHSLG